MGVNGCVKPSLGRQTRNGLIIFFHSDKELQQKSFTKQYNMISIWENLNKWMWYVCWVSELFLSFRVQAVCLCIPLEVSKELQHFCAVVSTIQYCRFSVKTRTKIIPCFFRPRRSFFQSHIFALFLLTHAFIHSFLHLLISMLGTELRTFETLENYSIPDLPSQSFFYFFHFFLKHKILLHCIDWPWNHPVAQAGIERLISLH